MPFWRARWGLSPSSTSVLTLKTVTLGLSLYAVLFFMGLNQAVRFPVTEVFIMGQTSSKHRSTIYGIYYSTMQYTGSIFAFFFGGIIEKYGFDMIFTYTGIGVLALAVITSLFIWDARDPQRYNP